MIDDALRTQLQHVLALVREPLRLIATVDEGPASTDMLALLRARPWGMNSPRSCWRSFGQAAIRPRLSGV